MVFILNIFVRGLLVLWTLISFNLTLPFSKELQQVLCNSRSSDSVTSVPWFPFYWVLIFRGRGRVMAGQLAALIFTHIPSCPLPLPSFILHSALQPRSWLWRQSLLPCAPCVWTHLSNNSACACSFLCQIPSPSPYYANCHVSHTPAGVRHVFLALCLCIFFWIPKVKTFFIWPGARPSYRQIIEKKITR